MESIFTYLNSLPQEYLFLGYLGLLFITMLGLVPNNSDLTIIVGTLFCLNSSFNIYQFTTSVLILVFLTENLTYFSGYYFGNRLKELSFIAKRLPKDGNKWSSLATNNPSRILLAIRLTPLFRPIFYFFIGTLRIKPKEFWKWHSIFLPLYVLSLISFTYWFAQVVTKYLEDFKTPITIIVILIWFFCMHKLSRGLKR